MDMTEERENLMEALRNSDDEVENCLARLMETGAFDDIQSFLKKEHDDHEDFSVVFATLIKFSAGILSGILVSCDQDRTQINEDVLKQIGEQHTQAMLQAYETQREFQDPSRVTH